MIKRLRMWWLERRFGSINDLPVLTREEQGRLRAQGRTNFVDNPGFESSTDGWRV